MKTQIIYLVIIFGLLVGYLYEKPPIVNIDNSYFTNQIAELNEEIKYLQKQNKEYQEIRDEDYKFREERCVCKPWSTGNEPPMTKSEICNTPDRELYFYNQL